MDNTTFWSRLQCKQQMARMGDCDECRNVDLLADEQYGSWQHKAAILQCLNKGLFYNILWQWKRPVALCSNDAKSCYNCITLLAAALSLCRLGATIPVVQSMVKMTHRMQHHIHTAYRDSQQAASRTTWDTPIAGISQGNRAGPPFGHLSVHPCLT